MAAVMEALYKELYQRGLDPKPYLVAFEEYCVGDTVFRHLLPLSPTHPKWHQGRCDRLHTHTYNTSIFVHPPPPCLPFLQDNSFWRWYIRKAVAKKNRRRVAGRSSSRPPDPPTTTSSSSSNTRVAHQQYPEKEEMKLWVSEFGTGGSAADLGLHVLRDLVTLRPSAWVYWQAVEDEGSPWGLMTGPISKAVTAQVAAEAATTTTSGLGGSIQAASASVVDGGGTAAEPGATTATTGAIATSAEFPVTNAPSLSVPGAIVLQPQYFVMKLLTSALRPGCQVFEPTDVRGHREGHARRRLARRKPKLQKGVLGIGACFAEGRRLIYILGNSGSKEAIVELDLSPGFCLAGRQGEQEVGQEEGGVVRMVVRVLSMAGLQATPASTERERLASLLEQQQHEVRVGVGGSSLESEIPQLSLPLSSLMTVEFTWVRTGEEMPKAEPMQA
jgi:hypothetical protein